MSQDKYGIVFPDGVNDATIELMAFQLGDEAPGSLGRYQHLHNAIDLQWNSVLPNAYMWNEWTELMQETFCENQWVTITGAGATWKTTSAAIYALNFWFSSPTDTIVILTSTTLPGLRRRIWKEVTRYYRINPAMGNLVQSQNCIQFVKGSDDAGIFGIAVDKGDISKAVGKIIGFHARNVLVVVDEMQYTSEAIVEACVNVQSGAERFQFIGLGNADDQLDPHGRMCEPKKGWDSIEPESLSWETKRGICLHLDALESPNVKVGHDIYPGMVKQRDIDQTIRDYGPDSPQFWQMRRGFWPPEGISRTVLSTPIITKFHAKERATWISDFTYGAALDPSFEGHDRCILRIGKCGLIDLDPTNDNPLSKSTRMIMIPGEIIQIKTDASKKLDPLHYQITAAVKQACIERNIPSFMFALDSTGEGGGLASIIQREWSPDIMLVEFGGRASSHPISSTNPKPAHEEYFNKVTELWFQFRLMVMNDQVRELDDATATEFCRRKYDKRGPLIQIEPKTLMKERTKQSPDLADATVILSELFRTRLTDFRELGDTYDRGSRWKSWRDKKNVDIPEESYAAEP